jgi:hypothetical protein
VRIPVPRDGSLATYASAPEPDGFYAVVKSRSPRGTVPAGTASPSFLARHPPSRHPP